jgi:hypothetical protein
MENQKKLAKRMMGIGAGLFVASYFFQTEESKKENESVASVMSFAGVMLALLGAGVYVQIKTPKK